MSTAHHHDHAHPHGHAHRHAHDESRGGERRRLVLTIVVVALVMVAEIVGGILARSLALVSDAGHMFSDVVAQGLALAALVIAARPADARRTFGWHRLEILAALGNGLMLLVLSGVILYEGVLRLRAPVPVSGGMVLVIAAIGLVANAIAAWLLHGAHSLAVKGAYLHVLGDAASSLAVLIGGAVIYFAHGLYWIDPVLSILIALVVLYSAYRLVREAVDVLLEAVPRGVDAGGVDAAMRRLDGVAGVHIWTITSGLYALSAHLVVARGSTDEHDDLLRRVEEMLLADFEIAHTTLQLESADYQHVGHVC